MKDIFIDNDIATNFLNPPTDSFKDLINWIKDFKSDDITANAYLVVSIKLLKEYLSSNRACFHENSIVQLVNKLTREGRLNNFSNKQIADFKKEHFTKSVHRKLTCNAKDRDHIPIILMSSRKMALSNDGNFSKDLANFPGFTVTVSNDPAAINYHV